MAAWQAGNFVPYLTVIKCVCCFICVYCIYLAWSKPVPALKDFIEGRKKFKVNESKSNSEA